MVGSSHRLSEVERTTPAAPAKERDHLLDGAATPPLPRRGVFVSYRFILNSSTSGSLKLRNCYTKARSHKERPLQPPSLCFAAQCAAGAPTPAGATALVARSTWRRTSAS